MFIPARWTVLSSNGSVAETIDDCLESHSRCTNIITIFTSLSWRCRDSLRVKAEFFERLFTIVRNDEIFRRSVVSACCETPCRVDVHIDISMSLNVAARVQSLFPDHHDPNPKPTSGQLLGLSDSTSHEQLPGHAQLSTWHLQVYMYHGH